MRTPRSLSCALLVAAACGGHPQGPTAPPASAPATTAAAPTTPPVPGLRLPAGARPTAYRLELSLDPTAATFTGDVDIDLDLPAGTTFLWLNAVDLRIARAELQVGTEKIPAKGVVGDAEHVGFSFAKAVTGAATLHIGYIGKVGDRGEGLYLQRSGEDRYLFTQLENTSARRVLPCFDEPSFKVPWRLTLHVPRDAFAASNTHIVEETDEGERRKVVFGQTPPLPSYLLALAVGPIEAVGAGTAGSGKTPLRILVPRGRAAQGAFAAGVTPKLLDRLETYFGIPFPYDKLDNLARPDGRGAMENAGLIISGGAVLIAEPASQSDSFKRETTETAAHEMAHQWFGDLVTTAWWDDIWLNEAFATWMALKVYAVRPEWRPEETRAQSRYDAMQDDVLANARQIRQPINSHDDIANAFDGITYQKGAAVLAMFEHAVGEEKFRQGVHDYLQGHAHQTATTAEFLAAVSGAAGSDVAPAFATFLDKPGLPLVTVETTCTKGKATVALTQRRYLPVGSKAQPAGLWRIPVCLKAGAGKTVRTACTELTTETGSVALDFCPDWVHGNAGNTGYYTVGYAAPALGKLVASAGQLDLAEQVGLVHDLRLQTVGGTLPVDQVLDAVARLAASSPPETVAAVATMVDDMALRGVVPGAQVGAFAAWVQRTLGARARALGWKPRPGENASVARLRGPVLEAVALHGRDKALQAEARALAVRWMDDRKAVPADAVHSVLRVAAWTGEDSMLTKARAALATADGYDRQLLLKTLLDFNDADLLEKAAQDLITDEFQPRDFRYFRGLEATGAARNVLFRFVREHWAALTDKLGHDSGALLGSGRPLCDETSLREYQEFFSDRAPRLLGGPRRYALITERIELCIAARKAQDAPMTSALKGK